MQQHCDQHAFLASRREACVKISAMRRFYLQRAEDPSSVSGTGRVAEGAIFSSGAVALHFNPDIKGVSTIYTYNSMEDLLKLHGHDGKSTIEWID